MVFCQKDANEKANSEDPDQTDPRGVSALFAQTYISENLGSDYGGGGGILRIFITVN